MDASRSIPIVYKPPLWGVAIEDNRQYPSGDVRTGKSLHRLTASVAVAVLVVFAASAARVTLPGVRENTRGTAAPTMVASHVGPQSRVLMGSSAGGAKPLVTATPWHPPATRIHSTRPARLDAPLTRAPGDNALGTGSLPKSRRSMVSGGHGRHGAG